MDISKYNNQKRPVRMFCDRPFDCSNGATETKVNTCEKLKGLFVAPVVDSVSDGVPLVGQGRTTIFGAVGVLSTELTDKIIRGLKIVSI